jgi:hypothetical protein
MHKKPNYTVDTCLAELDQIRKAYRTAKKGYRAEKYEMLQRSRQTIDRLQGSESLRLAFTKRIKAQKKKAQKTRAAERFDLSLEVVAKASGERKLAHKYARVLDYLAELGVQTKNIAKTLKKRGIEATYGDYQTTKKKKELEDPNPTERARGTNKSSEKKPKNGNLATGESSFRPKAPGGGPNRAGNNDREVEMAIRIKLSDRDRILSSDTGSRWVLSFVRGSEDDVLQLRSAMSVTSADEDWADAT